MLQIISINQTFNTEDSKSSVLRSLEVYRNVLLNYYQPLILLFIYLHHSQAKNTDDTLEVVSQNVKSLLNKLTVEKFDSISDQILNVGIANKEILAAVISIIFEKAIDEPTFGAIYASMKHP
jgi:hypothetical protein